MNYLEARDFIKYRLTSGSVYGLSRIKELLKRLDSPERCMKIIHIAGTNGKGSISRMIMSILCSAGYNVGIFNSPFLERPNEYLCCNGNDCTDDEYALIAGIVKNAVIGRNTGSGPMKQYPTEFEFSFAMALEYFARKNCDLAIIECGLGGLTDATNIFEKKELSIIANIGLDHTSLLGDSIEKIARQKSGIIIKNDTVVAYPSETKAMKVIKSVCRKKNAFLITPDYAEYGTMSYYNPGFPENAPVLKYEKIWINMPAILDSIALNGSFQKKNGIVALASAAALINKGCKIRYKDIIDGLKNVKWPGRFEILDTDPLFIADGGHNVQCVRALCDSLDKQGIKKAIFVLGIMADKDYRNVFKLLYPYVKEVIATEPSNKRRLPAEEICSCFSDISSGGSGVGLKAGPSTEPQAVSSAEPSAGPSTEPQAGSSLEPSTGSSVESDVINRINGYHIVKSPSDAVRFAYKLDKELYSGKMPIVVTGSLYMMADIRIAAEEMR